MEVLPISLKLSANATKELPEFAALSKLATLSAEFTDTDFWLTTEKHASRFSVVGLIRGN